MLKRQHGVNCWLQVGIGCYTGGWGGVATEGEIGLLTTKGNNVTVGLQVTIINYISSRIPVDGTSPLSVCPAFLRTS